MLELTIINEKIYEPYSEFPEQKIRLDNKRKLIYDKYFLQPAYRLDRIEGLIQMAYIDTDRYELIEKEYQIGLGKYLRAIIQGNKVIPILRISLGKERSISKYWPIIESIKT